MNRKLYKTKWDQSSKQYRLWTRLDYESNHDPLLIGKDAWKTKSAAVLDCVQYLLDLIRAAEASFYYWVELSPRHSRSYHERLIYMKSQVEMIEDNIAYITHLTKL